MNRGRFGRTLAVGICSFMSVISTGCIDTIAQNTIVGFGFSLGALPAQIVSDFIFGNFLGGGDEA